MTDTPPPSLSEAEARSRNARERLFGTLGAIQHKLNPMTLAQDAVENVAIGVARDTVATVRANPRTVATVAGAALLFLARKPLARLLIGGATAASRASLKKRNSTSKSTPHPKKGSRS
ncbi:phosphatase [Sphingomonas suaedae]|uniref:Phosphatase n=1 Tax=Sphingomonas suaedae TaxID=2599297 RepID=A0A518RC07_9SPHN|nr:phosphatase [Sphingomonas suaedae]QDX24978.1 phosphatase [Sphingomonas suaedae]